MKKNSLLIKMVLCFMSCMLLFSSPSQGCAIVGDISGDCVVDITDLLLMGQQWLDSGPIPADLDGQGDEVNYDDFAILAADWWNTELTGFVTVNIAGTAAHGITAAIPPSTYQSARTRSLSQTSPATPSQPTNPLSYPSEARQQLFH
jgi:hypothetical protein